VFDSGILEKLKGSRDGTLLAELGVWLHLVGKLAEEFLERESDNGQPRSGIDPETLYNHRRIFDNPDADKPQKFPQRLNPLDLRSGFFRTVQSTGWSHLFSSPSLGTGNTVSTLSEFVRFHTDWGTSKNILKILVVAHGLSSGEEKDPPRTHPFWEQPDIKRGKAGGALRWLRQGSKQTTYASTAFGFEQSPLLQSVDLTQARTDLAGHFESVLDHVNSSASSKGERLRYGQWKKIYYRVDGGIVGTLHNAYGLAVGDTQRPINDVTLWDASSLVAALFKSALAKMVLEGWIDPIDTNVEPPTVSVRWRMLRVNLNVLGFMAKGIKVGDILGYRERIDTAFNLVKRIIEIKFPLGNEIYRDTTGIYFSFPDIESDEIRKDVQITLGAKLRKAVQKVEPEFCPVIDVGDPVNDLANLTKERDKAAASVSYRYRAGEISSQLLDSWKGAHPGSEVCPICRLRPMRENRDGCPHCIDRRVRRARRWLETDPKKTLWLDEVADHNDRLALLVGDFDLSHWLDGSFIETLAKKTASSGRVRRVWETTQKFISGSITKDILHNFRYAEDTPSLGLRQSRLTFRIEPNPVRHTGATCELPLDGVPLSPVCVNQEQGLFVTTDNLQFYPSRWGKTLEEISRAITEKGPNLRIRNDETREGLDCTIRDVRPADESFQQYRPFISIYDSPDQFMALVPAWDALAIAERIVQEYEVQFSKVRDRLPFHLGVVAFHRRLPLYVIMDAGRRLLAEFQTKSQTDAVVVQDVKEVKDRDLPAHLQGRLGNRVQLVTTQSKHWPRQAHWYVSYSTGDPHQPDVWHPYFRLHDQAASGSLSFQDKNGYWLTHVKELRPTNTYLVEPSLFALEYLESAGDRFRIAASVRPLEYLQHLQLLWQMLEARLHSGKLSPRALRAFLQQVLEKRDVWGPDSTWEQLMEASLQNILKLDRVKEEDRNLGDEIRQGLRDGMFIRCLDWYLRVRKTPLKKKSKDPEEASREFTLQDENLSGTGS